MTFWCKIIQLAFSAYARVPLLLKQNTMALMIYTSGSYESPGISNWGTANSPHFILPHQDVEWPYFQWLKSAFPPAEAVIISLSLGFSCGPLALQSPRRETKAGQIGGMRVVLGRACLCDTYPCHCEWRAGGNKDRGAQHGARHIKPCRHKYYFILKMAVSAHRGVRFC